MSAPPGAALGGHRRAARRLQCGYHGWCFDADGSCTVIPAIGASDHIPSGCAEPADARRPWPSAGGLIFLAPEPPMGERLDLPFADADGFLHRHLAPTRRPRRRRALLDNFLDMAHFPFVHAATIGTEEALVAPEIDRRTRRPRR